MPESHRLLRVNVMLNYQWYLAYITSATIHVKDFLYSRIHMTSEYWQNFCKSLYRAFHNVLRD